MRLLIVAALLGTGMPGLYSEGIGDDITLPLDDGNIVISDQQFIRHNDFGNYVPELAFKIKNQTSSSWRTLKLQFDIGGLCNGAPSQWTLPVTTSLGWADDHQLVKKYADTVISLVGKVDGCKTEIIKAKLLFAENSKTRIDNVTGDRVDLEKQLQDLKAKQEAEAARQAEQERKATEAHARKEAAEAKERKRKQAEADAWYAKMKAVEDAKAAEERRKMRAPCKVIYQNTVDKRVGDLTVREEQQIRACQALGLYPPD